jgi:hypothetical protein
VITKINLNRRFRMDVVPAQLAQFYRRFEKGPAQRTEARPKTLVEALSGFHV